MKKLQSAVRTQKARGLYVLSKLGYGFHVPPFTVVDKPEDIPYGITEVFARPCPLVPAHGFVESRLVHSRDEAVAVLEEAKAIDPDAELILMEPVAASVSAIWTSGLLTIGPGNAGATSGRGTVTIPVTGNLARQECRNLAGIQLEPYLEFVYDGDTAFLVQLRDGPPVPVGVQDFIPDTFLVKKVVIIPEVEEDRPTLLQWKDMVKEFPPGTAVYHPGGALASHFTAHCSYQWAFNKIPIPVLTTREPHIGETLEPVSTPAREPDAEEMRRGFELACREKLTGGARYRRAVYLMLGGIHNSVLWTGIHDRLIGYGMGMAYRLCHTACMGELRHRYVKKVAAKSSSRDAVYTRWFNKTLTARHMLQEAIQLFYEGAWSSAFGGPKWGDFAWYGVKLYNRVAAGKYHEAIEVYNDLVNAVHNNGWAFNKFASQQEMNLAAKAGAYPVIQAMSSWFKLLGEPRKFKLLAWGQLTEPMVIENTVERAPVVVQAKIMDDDQVWIQVKWTRGERTPAYQVEVSDLAVKLIKDKLASGGKGTATSMGGTVTQYVVLDKGADWIWYVSGEPVVLKGPEKYATTREMLFPSSKVEAEEGPIHSS